MLRRRRAVLVGVGTDRRIAGVRVLEIKDTPGLGVNADSPTYFVDKAKKTTFPGQFAGQGRSPTRFVVKKDVVAITASTITSKALTNDRQGRRRRGAAAWLERHAQGGK